MKAEDDRASSLTATAPAPDRRYLDGRGASKARASLARILAVISTVPPSPDLEPKRVGGPEQGLGTDLNHRLGPSPESGSGSAAAEEEEERFSATDVLSAGDASVVEKGAENSVGECDHTEEAVKEEEEEKREAEEDVKRGDVGEGYLGLLLEAVRQVSGELFDGGAAEEVEEEEEETAARAVAEGSKRRRTCWAAPPLEMYEDCGPVVRSKRGRSQALPSRYRDSVLEPWAKPPTVRSVRTRTGR